MEFSKYLSFKNVLTFSGLNYLQAALSFLVSLILAKELGQYDYGIYTYGLVFANTLYILVQFGTDKTLVRDLVQNKEAEKILLAASVLKIVISFICLIAITAWALFLTDFELIKVNMIILCSVAGCILGISPKAWFDFKGKINQHAIIMLVDRFIFLFGSILFIFFFRNDWLVINVAICLVAGRLCLALFEWRYVRQTVARFKLRELKSVTRFLFQKNSWVWMAAIGNLLMTNANQIILDYQTGSAQLGLYGFALQLITLVKLLQNQILRLSSPSIAQIVQETNRKVVLRKFTKDCLLALGLTLAVLIPIYVLIPYLVKYLVGEEFMGALPIFNVLCIWILIYGVALISNQYLLSFHLQKSFFYTTQIFGLLSLYLAYVLIQQYGGVGAALSLLIAHGGSIIVQFLLVIFKIKQHARTD